MSNFLKIFEVYLLSYNCPNTYGRGCTNERKKKGEQNEGKVYGYRALFEDFERKGFLMSRRDERKLWPDISISVSGGGKRGRERWKTGRGLRRRGQAEVDLEKGLWSV